MFNRAGSSPERGQRRKLPMLSVAVVASGVFVALGGPAAAADGLISARDIAKGAVTGKAIKNGAVGSKDLSKRAKLALKGATGAGGATGATGERGANGLNGPNGPNGANGADGLDGLNGDDGSNGTNGTNGTNGAAGVLGPLSATAGAVVLATATPPTTVISLTVPAGDYIVFAKTQLTHSGAGDTVECLLKAGGLTIDQVAMKTLPALAAIPVSMQAVTSTAPTQLSVQCDVSVANGSADFSSLIAIPKT